MTSAEMTPGEDPDRDLPSKITTTGDDSGDGGEPSAVDLDVGPERELAVVDQLQADTDLFEALCADRFTGPGWHYFKVETARYLVDVLKSWLRKRTFAAELGKKHIPFRPTSAETDRLATDRAYRTSIIDMAVYEALEKFKEKGLAGKGWNPAKGALIRTWLTTAAIYEVINQLNARRTYIQQYERAIGIARGEHHRDSGRHLSSGGGDHAQGVADRDVLRDYLRQLSSRDRQIVWGKADHRTYKEIADSLHPHQMDSRAVERRWTWLRTNYDWIRRLDEKE